METERLSEQDEKGVRIAKYLASAGVAARRKCEQIIQEGRVSVDGQVVRTPAFFVKPGISKVMVDGHVVQPVEEKIYLMLNKPAGYTCTAEDVHAEHLIYELLPAAYRNLHYAGRLDRETEGLLLLSNDGEILQRLTHPSHQVPKNYLALCQGHFTEVHRQAILKGVQDEGDFLVARQVRLQEQRGPNQCLIQLTLTEGKKREVRRLCRSVGLPVQRLARLTHGPIKLGDLQPGKWRLLTSAEIAALKELK